MIPILFEKNETSFTSNGLGRLADCTRCIVTEERNGIYECEFDYPVTGVLFSEIVESRIIGCTHDERGDVQPFDIYRKTEPIDGIVTYYAQHISYRLNEITVKPFTAGSCAEAISKIKTQSVNGNPFTFWTNKSVTASYVSDMPKNARDMLAGQEGSILDVFGTGEYEFSRFEVRLYTRRGQDTNVSIRYGKNLVSFENDKDVSDAYTAVVPFWIGDVTTGDETMTEIVTLPEWSIDSGYIVPSGRDVTRPMDLSSDFEDKPTIAELRAKARARLQASDAWLPKQTIKVDFVQLWQTKEYEDLAPLQRLNLCDTCGVFVPMYKISVRAKIIRVVYNVLQDRYDEMELGDKPTTYAAVLEKDYNSKVAGVVAGLKAIGVQIETAEKRAKDYTDAAEESTKNYTNSAIQSAKATIEQAYQKAIDDATDQITGGTGGYVITTLNANNQPIELLITDNIDINKAVNVWRWNSGGLGHSHNGYNGPFSDVAITQDGKINASMILTGELTANLIKAGVLQDINGYVVFNLDAGTINIKRGSIDAGTMKTGVLNIGNGTSKAGLKFFDSSNYEVGSFDPSLGELKIRTEEGYYMNAYTALGESYLFIEVKKDGDSGYKDAVYLSGENYSTSSEHTTQYPVGEIGFSGELFFAGGQSSYVTMQLFSDLATDVPYSDLSNAKIICNRPTLIRSNFLVTGSKQRIVNTPNYGWRGHYCYETPTPLFGDIGESVLDEEGICYVDIDDIFSETVAERAEYQVFLQKEGQGDCWILEKSTHYFVIQGTPGLKVAWELKAKQRGYENIRLEQPDSGLKEYAYDGDPLDYTGDSYIEEQEALLYG